MIINTAKVKISLLEMPSFSPRNLSRRGQTSPNLSYYCNVSYPFPLFRFLTAAESLSPRSQMEASIVARYSIKVMALLSGVPVVFHVMVPVILKNHEIQFSLQKQTASQSEVLLSGSTLWSLRKGLGEKTASAAVHIHVVIL